MTDPSSSGDFALTPSRSAAWGAPVLKSVQSVVKLAEHVWVDESAIEATARWMAWEQFPRASSLATPPAAVDETIDATLAKTAINFAYTDFETHTPYAVEHEGCLLVDADAMSLRFDQALVAGIDLLDGERLRTITVEEVAQIFRAPTPMPLLEERTKVWNQIGDRLVERYDGHFHRFVHSCAPACWSGGDGILERLVQEFPRFDDSIVFHDQPVKIYKLAQLGVSTLNYLGLVAIKDVDTLSAFADYIVPAALRALGILVYSEPLARAIDTWQLIPQQSIWENEIRIQTLYATALLTDAINGIRPESCSVTISQLDYRIWSAFHSLLRPHHLTRTTMY